MYLQFPIFLVHSTQLMLANSFDVDAKFSWAIPAEIALAARRNPLLSLAKLKFTVNSAEQKSKPHSTLTRKTEIYSQLRRTKV